MIQLFYINLMKLNFNQLNKRQEIILNFIDQQSKSSISELILYLKNKTIKASRITIIRDLNQLIKLGFIEKKGQGRGIHYSISKKYNFIKPIDVEQYFKTEPDKRHGQTKFNFNLLKHLKDIFTVEEKNQLEELLLEFRNNIKKTSSEVLKKEFERITIELSWKSSMIEGNTYTLLETESLIKQGKLAKGHKKEEAIMILNHKKTLDYIRKNLDEFKKISIKKIENIHWLLVKDLNIGNGLRKTAVGITGTVYKPLDNIYQVRETLEDVCQKINTEKDIFSKALILILFIAYIQPFVDGNKRTSRLITNAILMAHNVCPLSYRSIDEVEYKKAVILFYEQNNLSYFKKLFIEQLEFAIKNYFK